MVKVTGTVSPYGGVPQMQSPAMEVVKAGVEAIPAQEITGSQMGADYLSEYVYIKDVTLGTYNASGSTPVTDAMCIRDRVVGEDNVTGVVGIAPAALVVVLIVGGSQMPALIQRHDVLLIAGIVAAGADLALAVTHLHHIHTAVNDGIPVGEVTEVAEGGAGMVELADGRCV